MYSYEDRIRAVKFYINCGYNAAYTVQKLGYPDASNLKHWYREYSQYNDLHSGKKKYYKYSDKEKRTAVDYYFLHDKNNFILLHSFRKKTQKTPQREITKAKAERDDYLKRKETAKNENLE